MSNANKASLLIRLPNWVGDVIMALPAIQLIQDAGIDVTLLGKPWIHDLLRGLDVPKITYPNTLKKNIACLKSCPEKNILLFTNSLSSAYSAKFARKNTIGLLRYIRLIFLNQAIKPPNVEHETDVFYHISCQALKKFYPHAPLNKTTHLIPELPIRQEAIENAQSLLSQYGIDFPFIVLCPFAHGLNRQNQPKKWPHWAAFAKSIKKYRPIVCPGPSEIEEAQQFFPDAIILPNLNLETYAAVLKLAKTVIANDSGPLHIAAAVRQQNASIGLFGVTPPERTGPKNARILGSAQQWPEIDEVLDFL